MTHWLLSVEYEYLTDMENAYGIIPIPKLNEDQDDYYSYTHDLMSVIGIPGTVEEEKLEMIGTALEELSAYSYNYTIEAFFEVALKGRYMRDEESRKMLDLIVDNLRIDTGWIYSKNLGGIAEMTRMPDALAGTMGNQVLIACFDTMKQVNEFIRYSFVPQKQIPPEEEA